MHVLRHVIKIVLKVTIISTFMHVAYSLNNGNQSTAASMQIISWLNQSQGLQIWSRINGQLPKLDCGRNFRVNSGSSERYNEVHSDDARPQEHRPI